jgi:DHA1 family tetracycline resistance protein-like MFS transporter
MALYSAGMLLFGIATESWMMFVFLIPYCLGGIAGPAFQAIISNQVPANEQGEIQGTLTSVMSASAIVGPPLMTGVFFYFTNKDATIEFAGAPFILASVLMVVSTILAYFALRKKHK